MRGISKILTVCAIPVLLSGCWLDDDDNNTTAPVPEPPTTPTPDPTPQTNVRITHAVADAPAVNILANGALLAGLENVDYQVSSGWLTIDEGSYSIQVDARLPGQMTTPVIGPADLSFMGGKTYDVLAVGNVATIEPLIIENDETAVTAGNARVQVLHGAANAPMVDIYVTAPDAELQASAALATLSFKEFSAQTEVPAGDYRVRITPAGTLDVVFDSDTLTLPDGADLLVAATDNVGAGDSPVTLLAIDSSGAGKVWDADGGAHLRVVHGVADAPAVDVLINNAATPTAPQLDGLAFPDDSGFLPVPAGTYLVDVVADADNSLVVIDDAELTLNQGQIATVIAHNALSDIALAVLDDDARPLATAAKVRIVHASPSAGEVDIYVTADDDISDDTPAFTAVPFSSPVLATTGYVELAEGSYYVTVTGTGSKEAAIGPLMLDFSAGQVATAIALDATDGGLPPQVALFDDAQPEPVVFSAEQTFNVSLSGAQEVPAVMTEATATAIVELDITNHLFRVDLDASNVSGVAAAHVHDGSIGTNGPVAFPLTNDGDGTFSLEATAITGEQISALQSGQWYLNVHTEANPSGEVRGQIVDQNTAVVTFELSGNQEIPRVTTPASGFGYATLNTQTLAVNLSVITEGVSDATMAHIHTGYAGENGPVYVTLEQDAADANRWHTPAGATVDAENAARLVAGGHYVNVHTPANPGGELRGQITAGNIQVYGVVASGAEEVPAVTTDASAVGAITLNTLTGEIIANMQVADMTPTMAHIHAGAVGENGPVVLPFSNPEAATWTLSATLDDAQQSLMQSSGLYVNFHSDAYPNGEIRGQITLGFD
ncbi:CHRD domain-containing protein [Aliiglaciecola sp. CAU 1673]|uniref:CHRD domain-containing protein n=1 Tax=Aliiglaciecola sp. CAU 1673 TaxID=3032595 RepID=UPI0023DBC4F3|nr:CHRD domain-containing protein [Aliiglaciecola sp. CAU 1673]MDF2179996.1 CHRD domain-containing protein [Aliiglaciecola sp. CAU 1673]